MESVPKLILVSESELVTEITPALYLCGIKAINDSMLKELGITLIINVTKEVSHYDVSLLQPNINLARIPVTDYEDTLIYPFFSVSIIHLIMIMKLGSIKKWVSSKNISYHTHLFLYSQSQNLLK